MPEDWEDKTVIATSLMPATPASRKHAQLVVLAGANVGEMFDVEGTQIMGRGRDADIRVQGDGISRQHLRLRSTDQEVVLEDLGSTNGCYVNGERIATCALVDGDKIQLGLSTILKFTYHDDLDEDFQRQMFESASRDALTQAYNKRFFVERLQSEFAFALRHNTVLTLLLFDIDHFKLVNDTYGHLAGDYVLATLAAAVAPTIRSEDVFARYGGEEFAVLTRSGDANATRILAERIRRIIEARDFVFDDHRMQVTVSIGLASLPHAGLVAPEDLIAISDKALYEAKHAGRNRVVVAP